MLISVKFIMRFSPEEIEEICNAVIERCNEEADEAEKVIRWSKTHDGFWDYLDKTLFCEQRQSPDEYFEKIQENAKYQNWKFLGEKDIDDFTDF